MRIALVAASALAVALVGQAAAADLPVGPAYRAPPVLIGYNWNGFYIGANIGWSGAQSNVSWAPNLTGFPVDGTAIAAASSNRLTSNSVTGGAQAGYNWQSGNILAGLEGDISLMGNNATFATSPLAGIPGTSLSESAQMNWLVTVRPRIGYVWDNWLFYATGGWAYGKVTFTDAVASAAGSIGTTFQSNRSGWTAGAGVEYGIAGGWSAKLEYLYVDLGSVGGFMGPVGALIGVPPVIVAVPNTLIGTNHNMVDQIVRVGINYRFGGEREVVVKYP
jgi:outer membrane immunogenic protein